MTSISIEMCLLKSSQCRLRKGSQLVTNGWMYWISLISSQKLAYRQFTVSKWEMAMTKRNAISITKTEAQVANTCCIMKYDAKQIGIPHIIVVLHQKTWCWLHLTQIVVSKSSMTGIESALVCHPDWSLMRGEAVRWKSSYVLVCWGNCLWRTTHEEMTTNHGREAINTRSALITEYANFKSLTCSDQCHETVGHLRLMMNEIQW